MPQQITISSPDWTTKEITADFAEGDSAEVATEAADVVMAYLILHTHEVLPGWSYTGNGSFTGEIRLDAVDKLTSLMMAAEDFVIERLDEIRAELATA